MSYQFESGEDVYSGTIRIVTEEIDEALDSLRGGGDRVKAVHNTRKSIKKLRAVVRLFEDEMGRKAFAAENRFLRDAGRSLSSTRDADVLIESFDGIAKRLREKKIATAIVIKAARKVVFEKRVLSEHDGTSTTNHEVDAAIAQAIGMLEEARVRVQNWSIKKANRSTVTDGMESIYRAGRRAMGEAFDLSKEEEHDDELFHDWRKRVKDLWYHTLLIQPMWPDLLDTYAEEAHKLADYLGDEHDLSILLATLLEHHQDLGEETFDLFADEIASRREHLRSKAQALGERLYAETPKAYLARIERYWIVSRG